VNCKSVETRHCLVSMSALSPCLPCLNYRNCGHRTPVIGQRSLPTTIEKKLHTYKPDSVFRLLRTSIIYLVLPLRTKSSCLPPVHNKASNFTPRKESRYTWHFNPQGLPPRLITKPSCALLPHIFTLTPVYTVAVIFCGTFCIRLSPEPIR